MDNFLWAWRSLIICKVQEHQSQCSFIFFAFLIIVNLSIRSSCSTLGHRFPCTTWKKLFFFHSSDIITWEPAAALLMRLLLGLAIQNVETALKNNHKITYTWVDRDIKKKRRSISSDHKIWLRRRRQTSKKPVRFPKFPQ